MLRYLLPLAVLAGCAQAPDPEPLQSNLREEFTGQRLAWNHDSGVGGEMIHYADGTMVYDSNGRERSGRWTLSADDRYCMNAGDYEQVCFTLVATPGGFASSDGTFRYTRLGGVIDPFGARVGDYGAEAGTFGTYPGTGYDTAPGLDAPSPMTPVTDAPIYGGSSYGASSYGTDGTLAEPFGASTDITVGPIR